MSRLSTHGCKKNLAVLFAAFFFTSWLLHYKLDKGKLGYWCCQLTKATLKPPYVPKRLVTFCTLVKNEGPNLAEWLDYHRTLGVSKVVLYDDGSQDGTEALLRPYRDSAFLDYYSFPPRNCSSWPNFTHKACENCATGAGRNDEHAQDTCQVAAILHCVGTYAKTADWLGFIDVDEYLFPCPGKNNSRKLPELLESLEKPVLHDDITIDCLIFGTSGYRRREQWKSLVASHTKRAPYDAWRELENKRRRELNCGKQNCVSQQIVKHLSLTKSLNLQTLAQGRHNVHAKLTEGRTHAALRHRKLCCNHYQFRSREEVLKKTQTNKNPQLLARFNKQGVEAYYNSLTDTSALTALHTAKGPS